MYAAAAAASNPYALQGTTGLISLAAAQNPLAATTAGAAAGSTGNPLLDAYSQYAALAAAGVYTTTGATSLNTSVIDATASKFFDHDPFLVPLVTIGQKARALQY